LTKSSAGSLYTGVSHDGAAAVFALQQIKSSTVQEFQIGTAEDVPMVADALNYHTRYKKPLTESSRR
jgi:hypothetical protein